jgi:ribosome-binding factor A
MSPRKFSARRSGHSAREGSAPSRKALQLCRQVGRTLDQIIAGELDDEALRGVGVHSVVPAPDESQLLVTVGPMAPGIEIDPQRVLAHLAAASGMLRAEVASAITRKKAPSLKFQVSPLAPGEAVLGEEAGRGEEEGA